MMTPWEERLHRILIELEGKTKALPHQLTEMFNLNNEMNKELKWPMEYGRHCPKCVQRVLKRLRSHYEAVVEPKYKTNEDASEEWQDES
jgi:pantothenate kinase-related protein Tda10